MLKDDKAAQGPQHEAAQGKPEAPPPSGPAAGEPDPDAVEQVLEGAKSSLDELQRMVQDFSQDKAETPTPASLEGIDLLGDVDLEVRIELGRTEMLVEDVLKLSAGSVVELDKLAGDPVDVYVNGRLMARGEVLVLSDNFCVRVSEIVANLEEEAQAAAQQQEMEQQATASS